MRRQIVFLSLSLICLAAHAQASGFRIQNQSLAAVGLDGAHIAHTPGADASYYNPANMVGQPDGARYEASLTTITLPAIDYADHRSSQFDGASQREIFVMPQVHIVSRQYADFRFGFSLVNPFGLSKRWDDPFPKASAEEFSLQVNEANPTFAYKINEQISVGGGLRLLYAKGEVASQAENPPISAIAPLTTLSRNLDGNTIEGGYNLALTYMCQFPFGALPLHIVPRWILIWKEMRLCWPKSARLRPHPTVARVWCRWRLQPS